MPAPAVLLEHDAALSVLAREVVPPGAFCGLVIVPDVGLGVAGPASTIAVRSASPATTAQLIDEAVGPRWVWWSSQSAGPALVEGGYRPRTVWDLAGVHRLLHGRWEAPPDVVWAASHGLPAHGIPTVGQLELLGDAAAGSGHDTDGDEAEPVRPDGYLRPDWASGSWLVPAPTGSPDRLLLRAARWARLAYEVAVRQEEALNRLPDPRGPGSHPSLPVLTARSESAAELLAVELAHDGLPLDRAAAEAILLPLIGERPVDAAHESRLRARRDAEVLRHLPGTDLRNPARVKAALATVGVAVPDTRSWRLRQFAGAHPAVEALLAWRKLDRLATTYGYAWLDRHVGSDGRLRGGWTGSDGAAGRMTAQAGLHNLPAELRGAVRADQGMVFVRADLGQVEPRVLAAVSHDGALAAATAADDLYLPIADELNCDRATAKVAVLAAMYGQTSGAAGEALRRMERAFPVALGYLRTADRRGREREDLHTYGGRLVRMWGDPAQRRAGLSERAARSAVAARGRYARNAVIQGAAAELFKMWAATVRAQLAGTGGRIVLCLHDELLVHVPAERSPEAAHIVESALADVAGRWTAHREVRFVADVRVVHRWSDAKAVEARPV